MPKKQYLDQETINMILANDKQRRNRAIRVLLYLCSCDVVIVVLCISLYLLTTGKNVPNILSFI
jgi:hypothetical protein